VFILSPDSMASVVCNMELDYAIELRKRIVPVVYQDVATRDAFASLADFTPDEAMEERLNGKDPLLIARDNWQRLSHINWVFFRESDDFDAAFETLVKTVETDLDYVKAHTRYLVRAQEWVNENRRADLLIFGSEIDRAEAWLQKGEAHAAAVTEADKVKVVNPLPQDLHREYIRVSRQADQRRRRLVRSAQLSIAVLVLVLVAGFGIGSSIITQTQQQVAEGQATLSSVSTQVILIEATVTQAAIVEQIVAWSADTIFQPDDDQMAKMDFLVENLYPNQPRAWYSRALIYAAQGNFESAIADYDEALRLNPEYTSAYNNRGSAKHMLGDLDGAIADFNEVLRLDPEHVNAYYNRGIAKQDLGDLQAAIADYDEALRLNSEYVVAYLNRAIARVYLEDWEGALSDWREAQRLGAALTQPVLDIIAQIEAELGITPTPAS
jgi:tetratricopeptide (TPR) repeat protein